MEIADKIEDEFDSLKDEINNMKMENYELTRMMFDISYKFCGCDIDAVKANFPELMKKLFNMRIEYLKTTYLSVFYEDLSENYHMTDDIFENYEKQYDCKRKDKAYDQYLAKMSEIKNSIENLLKNYPDIESVNFKYKWIELMKEGKFALDAYSRYERDKFDENNCFILPF
jgi:hypothetical protein